jgi:hypothetical protein
VTDIAGTKTLNEAIAILENRIIAEEGARAKAITDLRIFKTVKINETNLVATNNNDTLTIKNGTLITLTPSVDLPNTFTVNHNTITSETGGTF